MPWSDRDARKPTAPTTDNAQSASRLHVSAAHKTKGRPHQVQVHPTARADQVTMSCPTVVVDEPGRRRDALGAGVLGAALGIERANLKQMECPENAGCRTGAGVVSTR